MNGSSSGAALARAQQAESLHEAAERRVARDGTTCAANLILSASDELLARNGLGPEDVDWVVPHPGTAVVQQQVLRCTNIPRSKFVMNFDRVGNTSSASIPIVLSQYKHHGQFKRGGRALDSGGRWGVLLGRIAVPDVKAGGTGYLIE